ncbi:uncharacterized protein [Drosophila virilis]|uniref:uncharacterized protein n=1 Tax=Drosophila virilis TaxID=7244 RepID=UPI0038B3155A
MAPNIGWDDDLTNEVEADWQHWLDLLSNLNAVRIPRCMKWVSRAQAVQMHTFVDASMNAYAAVVFLRELDGQVHCSLVASKTRVAPLKPVSIPRMELMAAVLGLRLAKCIQKEMSVRIHTRTFWTDSKDVLYWIRSDARKFQQFIALRIGEILEESDVDSWRWVPSAQNVADDGTKWTKTPEIHGSTRWFNGPPFLYLEESQWPQSEIRPALNMLYHAEEQPNHTSSWRCILPDLQRISKLEKLRAVQLCVLDFLRNNTKKVRLDGELDLQKTLLLKRSNEMDVIFIRICQEEEFYSEITCLRSGRRLTDRKSLLFKCFAYVDDSGILRIKGRIDNIEGVEVCVKRPIILPRRHQLTYLLVEFYHRRYHHLHNEIVVNELRQRYWVCCLRGLVREVSNTCPACRIRRARPKPPGMGDLPIERLSPYTPPFTYIGVDYFGPSDIVVGRAIYMPHDADARIRMLSDNGTNFRGASRVLKDEIEHRSSALIERQYPELEFTFIPPGSPHMGGSWERMVRSTKSILSEILPPSGFREEVLRAALADVFQADCVREDYGSKAELARGFRVASQLAVQFWKRWLREYLPTLTRRTKWFQPSLEPISVDDIVIIVDDGAKRNCWTRGVVVDVHRSKDGQVRSAVVRTADGIITRPAVKLAKLDIKVDNTLHGRT